MAHSGEKPREAFVYHEYLVEYRLMFTAPFCKNKGSELFYTRITTVCKLNTDAEENKTLHCSPSTVFVFRKNATSKDFEL